MAGDEYRLTASQAQSKIRAGELTVEQYAQSLLQRIRERDDAVKAWAYLDPAFVLQQARELDKLPQEKRGPLHGVAVAVKDIIYTKGELLKCRFLRVLVDPSRHANTIQLAPV
jgi:Asp-tRNA(Asn)/Glu-tRNA(Gln) amidotransferase A subunit family amidase